MLRLIFSITVILFLASCNGESNGYPVTYPHDCQKIAAAIQDSKINDLTGYDLRAAKDVVNRMAWIDKTRGANRPEIYSRAFSHCMTVNTGNWTKK